MAPEKLRASFQGTGRSRFPRFFTIRFRFQKRELLRRIAQKRERLRLKIERLTLALTDDGNRELVTEERRAILDCDIAELSERLRSGALDPVVVLEAYQVRDAGAAERDGGSSRSLAGEGRRLHKRDELRGRLPRGEPGGGRSAARRPP